MKDLQSNFLNSQNYKSTVNLPIAVSLTSQTQNPAINLQMAFQGFFNNPSEAQNDPSGGFFGMSGSQTSPPLPNEPTPINISLGNKPLQKAPSQYGNSILTTPRSFNEMNRHALAEELGQNKVNPSLGSSNSLSRPDLNTNSNSNNHRGSLLVIDSKKQETPNNNPPCNSYGINPLMMVYQNTTPNPTQHNYEDTPMPCYKIEVPEFESLREIQKQPAQFSKAFSVPQYNSNKFNFDDEKFDEGNQEPLRHTIANTEKRNPRSMPSIFDQPHEPKFSVPASNNNDSGSQRNQPFTNQLKNLFNEPSTRLTITNQTGKGSYRNIQGNQLTLSPKELSNKLANNSPSYSDLNYNNPISQTNPGESDGGAGDDDFTPDIFQKVKILEEEVTKLKALNDQKSIEIKTLNRKIGNPNTELKTLMDERAQQEIKHLKEDNYKLRMRVQDLESLAFRKNNDAFSKKVNGNNNDYVTKIIMLEHENRELKEQYKNFKAIANNGTYQDLETYLKKIQEMEAYIKDLKRKNERLEAQLQA